VRHKRRILRQHTVFWKIERISSVQIWQPDTHVIPLIWQHKEGCSFFLNTRFCNSSSHYFFPNQATLNFLSITGRQISLQICKAPNTWTLSILSWSINSLLTWATAENYSRDQWTRERGGQQLVQHRNIVHGLFPKKTCRNSENQKGEKWEKSWVCGAIEIGRYIDLVALKTLGLAYKYHAFLL
jgi:hypothetical protein